MKLAFEAISSWGYFLIAKEADKRRVDEQGFVKIHRVSGPKSEVQGQLRREYQPECSSMILHLTWSCCIMLNEFQEAASHG